MNDSTFPASYPTNTDGQQRKQHFRNRENVSMPPYAAFYRGDAEPYYNRDWVSTNAEFYAGEQEDGPHYVIDAYRANEWNVQNEHAGMWFFNGPEWVKPGKVGECTQDFPAVGLHIVKPSTGGVRSAPNGTTIGPRVGKWSMDEFGRALFVVQSHDSLRNAEYVVDGDTVHTVRVVQNLFPHSSRMAISGVETNDTGLLQGESLFGGVDVESGNGILLPNWADSVGRNHFGKLHEDMRPDQNPLGLTCLRAGIYTGAFSCVVRNVSNPRPDYSTAGVRMFIQHGEETWPDDPLTEDLTPYFTFATVHNVVDTYSGIIGDTRACMGFPFVIQLDVGNTLIIRSTYDDGMQFSAIHLTALYHSNVRATNYSSLSAESIAAGGDHFNNSGLHANNLSVDGGPHTL